MTFKWFKKHEKPILWVTVIFTVLIFATFSGLSDLQRMIEPGPPDLAGTFTVATTGETKQVGLREFGRIRRNMARLFGGRADIDDDMIWAHVIMVADAEGAGIRVSDPEVATLAQQIISGGQPISHADYQRVVLGQLQFSSLRAFEDFLREVRLSERWQEVLSLEAGVVTAEDAFKRWSVDNEVFDFEALVFPDRKPEEIPDPGDDELRAWYDELPENSRATLFVDPARQDIVYGWIALDADLSAVPEDVLGGLEEPTDEAVAARFELVGAVRFPAVTELDDATREALRNELRVMALASLAQRTFTNQETKDKDTFVATMEAHGLTVVDPEGLLGPDELENLEDVGSRSLAGRLRRSAVGSVSHLSSRPAQDDWTKIVFVEAVEPERPLDFDEGRDQVLEEWRKQRVGQVAIDFRAALREAARALPEAQEAIAPLEQAAREAAEAQIAASAEELDEAARQATIDDVLAGVEPDILARVAEFENQVWDAQVATLTGVETKTYTDVSRNRSKHTGEDVDTATLDFYLKTNFQVFQQAEGGITNVMRHQASESSAIVRVTDRRMLELTDMLADEEGMIRARQALGFQQRSTLQESLDPVAIMESHDLRIAVYEEQQPAPAGS